MLPKISIVTPSFNQGAFIEETIQSVLSQDYPNLEYIVIDGGSSDQSVDIIRKYESSMTYWVSEKDSGQSEAINKGFRMATGEIVSWLCSDDLYLPGTLHKAAAAFQSSAETILIHGQSILFNERGKEILKGADRNDLDLRYFSVIPFPQPSSFFRKKLIEEQGLLREDLHFAMDYDLLVRAALHYRIKPVDDVLSRYRLHKKSKTTSSLKSFALEWKMVFSKFLRSVKHAEGYIRSMEDCGLYLAGDDAYRHQRTFTERELKLIVLYYLDFMAHLHYLFVERENTLAIISLVKKMDADFYRSRKLSSISNRARYLPASFIRFLRGAVQ